jgi:hypothetical protein
MGPYLLVDRLTAQKYLDFLGTVLPGLVEDMPLAVSKNLRFHFQRTMGKMPGSGPM